MKHFGSRLSTWTAYAATLLAATLVGTAQAKEGSATVRAIRGTADYSTGGGTWQKLSVGKVLGMGATIRTAADSEVDLFLKDNGPVVRVTPETTLGLDTLLFEETGDETVITTKLDLKNGRILGNVKKLAAASKYEVQIPSGVVGIRGTDYDISADGVVRVISGLAVVFYTENGVANQAQVSEGMAFNAQNKQVTQIPQQVITQLQQVIQQLQNIVLQLQGPVVVNLQPQTTVPTSTTGE
ncbi:MAG: FecR domain-containing protein [Verrucomicrobia bacterium]|nr:FecR domain-containing protein [Verrucomicrobiota bacterium]